MSDLDLSIIQKNGHEQLRLSLSEYKGARFLSLRTFVDIGGGNMVPTKKGVTIPLWAVTILQDALLLAQQRSRGPCLATVTSLAAHRARVDAAALDPFDGEVIDTEPDGAA